MNKKQSTGLLLIGTLVAANLLAGCSVARFRQPEEVPPQQLTPAVEGKQNQSHGRYEAEDLIFEKELALPSGAVTATYHAALPQFQETGDKAPILKKINEYYEIELEALKQDCESYFDQIQKAYGDGWHTAEQAVSLYSVNFTYEVVNTSAERISLVRTYRYMDINMKEKVVYTSETFDCTTGWPLRLEELFRGETQAIEQLLNEQITEWCKGQNIERGLLPQLTLKKQESSFAIGEDTLYLCLDETGISSVSPGARLVEIPLKNIESILRQELTAPIE